MKKFLVTALILTLILGTASAFAENQKIQIGADVTPHTIILEFIKDDLAALGFDLEIVQITDYFIANPATSAGDLDANYFQHVPFLDKYNVNVSDGDKLVAAIPMHYEPYGVYAGTKAALDLLEAGDHIAVPNDPSNETRALLLLRDAGIITLPEDATWDDSLTALDVVDAKGLIIDEISPELIPSILPDVAFAVINGNYAIGVGLNPAEDALFLEPAEGESGKTYTNYIVVKPENENAPFVQALRKVLYTKKVQDFILNHEDFKGGVIPTFPEIVE